MEKILAYLMVLAIFAIIILSIKAYYKRDRAHNDGLIAYAKLNDFEYLSGSNETQHLVSRLGFNKNQLVKISEVRGAVLIDEKYLAVNLRNNMLADQFYTHYLASVLFRKDLLDITSFHIYYDEFKPEAFINRHKKSENGKYHIKAKTEKEIEIAESIIKTLTNQGFDNFNIDYSEGIFLVYREKQQAKPAITDDFTELLEIAKAADSALAKL